MEILWSERGFYCVFSGRQAVGHAEEPSSHELRQTQPLHPPVLPEGHHEEDGTVAAARLPVLPSVRPLIGIRRALIYIPWWWRNILLLQNENVLAYGSFFFLLLLLKKEKK